MIYTGYYAKHGKLHNAVSISVYKPKWLPHMLHLPLFAPSWDLVKRIKNGEINEEQYVEEFLKRFCVVLKLPKIFVIGILLDCC